ncbi:MAG: chitobiase/beta-hexosaminidase C-terminal domain-containing protein [Polyangiaceae bacterium]|nr:chitobiase/beta-hexosaminidase C-terminal domain-containing protein [Polyangiaceae bacterium]
MRVSFARFGFACAIAFTASSAAALSGTTDPLFIPAKDCSLPGVNMNCVLWEPANYNPATKYPLIVYMHGAGQSGWDANPASNMERIENTKNFAAMLMTVVSEEMGVTNGEYLVMMPQAPDFETTPPNGGAYVQWDWGQQQSYSMTTLAESPTMQRARAMIDQVRGTHNVDADRIYAIGVSMGGFGAWDAASRYPGVFAATLPSAGGGSPDAASLLKNMAIWSHHSDADGAVPSNSDREMFRAVALAGGRPVYTETISSDHSDGGVSSNPNYLSWMLAQRRGVPATSNPALAFDPPGGALTSPVMVTISSDQGSNIRYTLDGTVPSSSTGMVYNGPIALTDSVVLIAMVEGGGERVFHAAPFQVDGKPLPAGAELVNGTPPPLPPVTGSGGSNSGPTSGGGGTPNVPNPASGGAFNASGGAASASGGSSANPFPSSTGTASAPVPSGTTPVPGSTPAPAGGTTAPKASRGEAKSGCALHSSGQGGEGTLAIFGLVLGGLALSRRKRSF